MEDEVKYVVYIDVFWFVNFIMDMYIIMFVRRWNNCKRNRLFCVLSSVFGAFVACAKIIYSGNKIIGALLWYVLACVIMSGIAFGKKNIIKNIILIYILSVTSGGICDFLYYQIGIKNVLIIWVILYCVTFVIWEMIDRRVEIGKSQCEVNIVDNGERLKINAIIDTGNSLREPYLNRHVHIIEKEQVYRLTKYNDHKKILVPYHSLGCENGIIEAMEVDKLIVKSKGKIFEEVNSVVGIYEGNVSGDGLYSMIINPAIFRESGKGEYK